MRVQEREDKQADRCEYSCALEGGGDSNNVGHGQAELRYEADDIAGGRCVVAHSGGDQDTGRMDIRETSRPEVYIPSSQTGYARHRLPAHWAMAELALSGSPVVAMVSNDPIVTRCINVARNRERGVSPILPAYPYSTACPSCLLWTASAQN